MPREIIHHLMGVLSELLYPPQVNRQFILREQKRVRTIRSPADVNVGNRVDHGTLNLKKKKKKKKTRQRYANIMIMRGHTALKLMQPEWCFHISW